MCDFVSESEEIIIIQHHCSKKHVIQSMMSKKKYKIERYIPTPVSNNLLCRYLVVEKL